MAKDFEYLKWNIRKKNSQLIPRLPSSFGDYFSSFNSISFKAGPPAAQVVPVPDFRKFTREVESNLLDSLPGYRRHIREAFAHKALLHQELHTYVAVT